MQDRREFMRLGLSALGLGIFGGLGSGLLGDRGFAGAAPSTFGGTSPFLRLPANSTSVIVDGIPFAPWFTGDDFPDAPSIPFHSSWQGQPPTTTEKVDVAIVGGGISGLASAYLLRRYRPVLFELRPRFGGNAFAERWRETAFSLGSAYVITPDAGTFLDRFYRRLGLDHLKVESFPPDPVEVAGQVHTDFWSGAGFSPVEQRAFEKYARIVTDIANNSYPEIPLSSDPSEAARVMALDQLTFRQDLEARMGMPLTPFLAAGLQGYFYSSFGAGIDQISAASGWNFVAAEEFGRWVFPGGNASLAHQLWKRLRRIERRIPSAPPMLRADCRVVDVRRVEDRVQVTWVDSAGQDHALLARAVVMAGSKHVCKHVIHDLENLDYDKYTAMQEIHTSAYVVANVLLNAPAPAMGYDVFLVGDRSFPMNDIDAEAENRPIDVLHGSFALDPALPRSALTLYWPLPWPTARFSLLMNDPYQSYAARLVPHLQEILTLLNVPVSAVEQVRLSRWGHAMPIARPGVISSGVPEHLLRPFAERVFFVNQDNWALPAVENSLLDAKSVTDEIKVLLG